MNTSKIKLDENISKMSLEPPVRANIALTNEANKKLNTIDSKSMGSPTPRANKKKGISNLGFGTALVLGTQDVLPKAGPDLLRHAGVLWVRRPTKPACKIGHEALEVDIAGFT